VTLARGFVPSSTPAGRLSPVALAAGPFTNSGKTPM